MSCSAHKTMTALPIAHDGQKGALDPVPSMRIQILVLYRPDAIIQRIKLGRNGIDAEGNESYLFVA